MNIPFFDNQDKAATGVVTSIVPNSMSVDGLTFQHTGAGASDYHTLQIDGGATLTVDGRVGTTSNAMMLGLTTIDGVTTRAAVTGDGTLTVNSPSYDFRMTGFRHAGGVKRSALALDMSGLDTFHATVNEFLAPGGYINTTSQLTLAETNTITADATVFCAWGGSAGAGNFVHLGQTNTLHTNKLVISGGRASSTTEFASGLSGTPTVEIRGKAGGTSRADLWIADQNGNAGYGSGGSSSPNGLANFTAGSIDAMLDVAILGRNGYYASNQPGGARATLSFNEGSIDATTIVLARTPAVSLGYDPTGYSAGEGHTRGTIHMGGGSLTVGSMMLGEVQGHGPAQWDPDHPLKRQPSTMATGTLNITGGDATVTGNVTLAHHTSTGEATATGIINLSGGTLSAGSIVEGNAGSGTNVAEFNWTGGTLHVDTFGLDLLNDDPGAPGTGTGTLAPGRSIGTTSILGDYTQGAGATLQIEIADFDDFDFVNVTGNADLDGTLEVILDGYTPTIGDQFLILHATTLEGTFAGIDDAGATLASPGYWGLNYDYEAGDVYLHVLPEPATMTLLALGAACLALRRRKR